MSSAWDNWVAGMADSEANFSQLTKQSGRQYCNSGREYSTEGNRNSAEAGSGLGEIVEQACNVYTTGYTGVITAFNERRTGLALIRWLECCRK